MSVPAAPESFCLTLNCSGDPARTDRPVIFNSTASNYFRMTEISKRYPNDLHITRLVSKVSEIAQTIREVSERGKIELLIINGHGSSEEGISVGPSEMLSPNFEGNPFVGLPKKSKIYLFSCSKEDRNRLAIRIAQITSCVVIGVRRNIYLPPFSFTILDQEGRLNHHCFIPEKNWGRLPLHRVRFKSTTVMHFPNGLTRCERANVREIWNKASDLGYPAAIAFDRRLSFEEKLKRLNVQAPRFLPIQIEELSLWRKFILLSHNPILISPPAQLPNKPNKRASICPSCRN